MKKTVIHLINSVSFSGLENVVCDIISNSSSELIHIYVTRTGSIIDVLKEKNISYEIIDKMSIKEVRRVVKKYKADVIHAHDYTASCIASMSLVRIPIISHLHNNSPWIKTFHPFSFLYLFCSLRFKKILTVSESIEKEYVFRNFINNKICCISNPVSVEKILNYVEKKDFEKKYDICCIGRLTNQKNPLKFLHVISELKKTIPNLKAIWLGEGELKESVVTRISELHLENNIELLGFRKNPYPFLASSKVFLLTSDWEGYGLVAFEALSLGVPAVVSNVGGLPNIVDNTCGFLCTNISEYSAEIEKLLLNKEYYSSKSNAALIKSKKIDNSEEYFLEIDNLYRRIIND